MDLARHRIVDMGRDDLADRVAHEGQLLGKLAGGKEVDALLLEAVAEDEGEELAVVLDGFKHDAFPMGLPKKGQQPFPPCTQEHRAGGSPNNHP